jgi:hypothetical protein
VIRAHSLGRTHGIGVFVPCSKQFQVLFRATLRFCSDVPSVPSVPSNFYMGEPVVGREVIRTARNGGNAWNALSSLAISRIAWNGAWNTPGTVRHV